MVRFSPGCKCCEGCEPAAVDEFNRDELGPDWFVHGGTWTCNGSQLVGSGGVVQYIPPPGWLDPEANAVCTVKLDQGTAKVCFIYGQVGLAQYDYVQIGDGEVNFYVANGFGGHSLLKTETGAPSTGDFAFCYHGGGFGAAVSHSVLTVESGDYYVGATIQTGLPAGRYIDIGFDADSSIQVDRFELYDSKACCSRCPACLRNDVPGAPAQFQQQSTLVVDFGERDPFVCNGVTLSGQYILDQDPIENTGDNSIFANACRYFLNVIEGPNNTGLEVQLGASDQPDPKLFFLFGGNNINGGPTNDVPLDGVLIGDCRSFSGEANMSDTAWGFGTSCLPDQGPYTIRTP